MTDFVMEQSIRCGGRFYGEIYSRIVKDEKKREKIQATGKKVFATFKEATDDDDLLDFMKYGWDKKNEK